MPDFISGETWPPSQTIQDGPEVNTDYRAGNVNQGSDFYAAPQIKSIVVGLTIGL